jgi:Inclusion body protein
MAAHPWQEPGEAMPNSQIHDVLVVIDTETILRKYPPDPTGRPIEVTDPEGLVTFVGPGIRAAPNLNLDGAVLDVIRMRERSVLLNIGAAALFYDFDINPQTSLMTRPEPIVYSCIAPKPGSSPVKSEVQRLDQYVWQSTVVKTEQTASKFSFLILEAADDEFRVLGRYFWLFTINERFSSCGGFVVL